MSLLPDIEEIKEYIQNNSEKCKIKKKSKKAKGKKTKMKSGRKYKETEEERNERVRNFMTPIYQPMGLGKRR